MKEDRRGIPCPRCGVLMEYRMEVEVGNGIEKRIAYYYRCPRCGYRLTDANIYVKKINSKIMIRLEEPRIIR